VRQTLKKIWSVIHHPHSPRRGGTQYAFVQGGTSPSESESLLSLYTKNTLHLKGTCKPKPVHYHGLLVTETTFHRFLHCYFCKTVRPLLLLRFSCYPCEFRILKLQIFLPNMMYCNYITKKGAPFGPSISYGPYKHASPKVYTPHKVY